MGFYIKDTLDLTLTKEHCNDEGSNYGSNKSIFLFDTSEEHTNKLSSLLEEIDINSYVGTLELSTKIENVDYRIKIGNIPVKYLRYDKQFGVSDIILEYCENIIKQLYKSGCRFDTDEIYDFQEFLV